MHIQQKCQEQVKFFLKKNNKTTTTNITNFYILK